MRQVQANVGRGVSKAEFRRNIVVVKRFAGPKAVINVQEVDEADVPNEMDDIAWLWRWTHKVVGDGLAVPILVPKRFDTFGHRVVLGSPGLARFTPHRPINRIGITLPLSRRAMSELGVTSLDIYDFNFHVPISRDQTEALRGQMLHKVSDEVRGVKELGYGGVWTADTNWRKRRDGALPRVVSGEKQAIGGRVGTHAEIDVAKAWAGERTGLKVKVENRRHANLTIDGHNAHSADILWVPSAA